MFWIIFSAAVCLTTAAKLDNTYLPPPSSQTAGGNGDSLQPPQEGPYGSGDPAPHARGLQLTPEGRRFLENEAEIKEVNENSFDQTGSRFLSGSYSYTGPDNVLVTVTYKADDKPGRKQARSQGQGQQNGGQVDGVIITNF